MSTEKKIIDLDRGTSLNNKETITVELPAYLPDIRDYVYCTCTNTWIHNHNVYKRGISNDGIIYLRDKNVCVSASIYGLEHNIEEKKQLDSKDIVIDLSPLPQDILNTIIGCLTSTNKVMYYRMCLVSKKIREITLQNTRYEHLMLHVSIGRYDNDILTKCNESIVDGVIKSGNFCIEFVIRADNAYKRLVELIEGGVKWDSVFGNRLMKTLEWYKYHNHETREKLTYILSCFNFTDEDKIKAREYLKTEELITLIT